MKSTLAIGAVAAALFVSVGCSSAPEADDAEQAEATEDAIIGRDPNNCRFNHRWREWAGRCEYSNATLAQMNDMQRLATHAQGALQCGGLVVSAVAAASSVSIGLVPVTVAAAAGAADTVADCVMYIGELLGNVIPTSCWSYEVNPSEQTRALRCAQTCGGSDRVYNGDCYCGVGNPLACRDGAPTPTPSADTCYNVGNGQTVPRGQCTLGYTNGAPNGAVYRCNSSGQDWRECPRGTSLAACSSGTACR